MSDPFEEIFLGESLMRRAPDARHEAICSRLHQKVNASLPASGISRLLAPRSMVELSPGTMVRPDLVLTAAPRGKLWLAAEVVNIQDHKIDTVAKKRMYEELNIPRLWMIDPRYDNVEVYCGTSYGLSLVRMLSGADLLEEKLLPELRMRVADLFGNGL